jgi:hypothetical protein
MRLQVRSRRWNWVLAILGSMYAVSAILLLVWYVIDVWEAEALSDRVMQIALLGSAIYGLWILFNALANLGVRGQKRWHTRLSRSTAG